ncbi:hypothetical protein F4774DRAFT_384061 [Daldinia eschscholtzii]|nr:hypothetical protein F4774DRAFT_384061 [Daldinia eschscholtzii]
MARGGVENWWYRNRMDGKFPKLPIKRELIYHIFRAAYPHGAFVDDDLKLVDLRDKEEVWDKLECEIGNARADLDIFIFCMSDTYGVSPTDRAMIKQYYGLLLDEAEGSLFRSQNGRYFEFRCMEELLVRYRMTYRNTWALYPFKPEFALPPIAGYKYATDALEEKVESKLHFLTLNYLAMDGHVRFPVF